MARHSLQKPKAFKRAVASTSLFALAATPLVVATSSSYGSDACTDLDNDVPGATAEPFSGDICQITFTAPVTSWTLPSQVTRVSAFGVGGGGGALSDLTDGGTAGYGGAGGQLNMLDTVPIPTNRLFNITIGAGGENTDVDTSGTSGNAGGDTILKTIVEGSPATALLTAAGGLGGDKTDNLNASWRYGYNGVKVASDEEPIFNNQAFGSNSIPGAGTGGNSRGDTGAGGLGWAIEIGVDAYGFDYLDPTLWAANSYILGEGVSLKTFEFGEGGSITSTPNTSPNSLSGKGADVSATGSAAGASGNGVLIMRFALPAPTYTVSFNANGGTGSMSNQTASSATALTSNTFERSGYTFAGWNTEPSGTGGVSYANGADYGFTVSDTLYAQWSAVAPPASRAVPYQGPIGLRKTSSSTCVGDLATITGSRLGSIKNIYVDGTDIPFTLISDSEINFNVPNMKAGTYQLKYWVPVNSVNLTDKITIGSCSVAVTEPDPDGTDDETTETEVGSGELTPFYIAKRFTSYRGDRGAIVAADREAITAFIAANPGLTHITCVGSTSGQPASPTDQALAMARAENACSVVENLVPGITTRMVTSTGRGVGQFFRAVTLFGKGLREN